MISLWDNNPRVTLWRHMTPAASRLNIVRNHNEGQQTNAM
ncbi:hypothetical protein ACSA002_2056 [Salmonella phage vB_SalM_SA002]|nr:hypothetical protein ACSA002_2056 [Salmonella phage vB_SalM_SA002]